MTKTMMKKIANAEKNLADKKVYLKIANMNLENAIKNNDTFRINATKMQIQLLECDIRQLENFINEAN